MKKVYIVFLISCIIGISLHVSFNINKDDTVFIDMKIPEGYIDIYDNHIHDMLEDLKAYTFECYGYNTKAVVSYYLYDLDNHRLHLIRIIE